MYRYTYGRTKKTSAYNDFFIIKGENDMKRTALILTALILALTLASCGQKKQELPDSKPDTNASDTVKPDNGKSESEITPASVEKAIADAIGSENYLCDTDIDEAWLKNSFGFDMSKIKSYVAKQNSISAVNLDTVIILEVEDGYADTAVEIFNDSYAQTVSYIRQYAFGVGKVMNARIYKEGSYVMYILAGASYDGDDAEKEDELAVSEYKKIDSALNGLFGETPKNLAVIPEDDGNSGGLIIDGDMDDDVPMLGGNR